MTDSISCRTCSASVSVGGELTVGALRAYGWRIWDGLTLTGVSQSVRICPACIGSPEGEADDDRVGGFTAECHTCDSTMDDDWSDDVPQGGFTEDDAKGWKSDHQCAPWVTIEAPRAKADAR